MKNYLILVLAILMVGCSPAVTVTGSWKNNDELNPGSGKYKNVFISTLTGNLEAKSKIENDLAKNAKQKGFNVILSSQLFPPEYTKENAPDQKTVVSKIRAAGCDAIFTVTLIDSKSETRYVPGTSVYQPYPYRPYYGMYWSYHSYWHGGAMYNDPGYYTTDKVYFVEANLYDATTEKILWSAQTKTVNPSGIDSFSAEFAKAIFSRLHTDGLL